MKDKPTISRLILSTAGVLAAITLATGAWATSPCDDFGECKTLIEINSTDGDIGFHFLVDGDDLNAVRLHDPDGVKVYENMAKGPLTEQKLTENFAESAEPLCWDPLTDDDEENDEDEFVTLEEFLERWADGTYVFTAAADGGEKLEGESELTYLLPAAPDLESGTYGFDGSVISWGAGDDLGECADFEALMDLVDEGVLPEHPVDVEVETWEIVFEPDIDDEEFPNHPVSKQKFTIRVAGDISPMEVTVPSEFLDSLPDDQLVKIEVGAIGSDDNATFTEIGDICVNEDEGCEED